MFPFSLNCDATIALYEQYASERVMQRNGKFTRETKNMFKTIGLPVEQALGIMEEIRKKSPELDDQQLANTQEYLARLVKIGNTRKSYGKMASEFVQEWLQQNSNSIKSIESKFEALIGTLSQKETDYLGATINCKIRSLTDNERTQIGNAILSAGKEPGEYFKELLGSLVKEEGEL